jgi:hypothetical protein
MRRAIAAFVLAASALFASADRALARDPAAVALDRVLPEVRFENVTLTDAIDFLRDVSSANIHVNWKAMEPLLVGPDTLVNLRLRGVTLRKILSTMLADTGMSGQLAFYVDRGVIEITTREIADSKMLTRVYDIADLLLEIPDFEGPDLSLSSSVGRNNGSNEGLLSRRDDDDDEEETLTKAERAEQIVQLIQETIQPDIWRENGGKASIRYFRDSLIVTAPRSVHEAIGGPID